ncbi:MAG: nuclease-related domain-containing protein [Waterburya sp.]
MNREPTFLYTTAEPSTSAIRALGNFRATSAQVLLFCGLTGVLLILYMIYSEYWLQKSIHPLMKILPFVLFLGAIASRRKESQAAQNAHQGATAEEKIFILLELVLVPLGWNFQYNYKLAERWDIDVVALSPAGKTYIIDVKSHKGTKLVTEDGIYRVWNGEVSCFKKDLLKGVLRQAVTLRNRENLRWVSPIICFTEGWIEYQTDTKNPQKVLVVSKRQLTDLLLSLG